ncbi:hypothetical protein VWY07_07255 [Phaeobacter sp. JH18-11]
MATGDHSGIKDKGWSNTHVSIFFHLVTERANLRFFAPLSLNAYPYKVLRYRPLTLSPYGPF